MSAKKVESIKLDQKSISNFPTTEETNVHKTTYVRFYVSEILPILHFDRTFVYLDASGIVSAGDIVEIPFGKIKSSCYGLCISCKMFTNWDDILQHYNLKEGDLKSITALIQKKVFTEKDISFLQKFAKYNILSLGKTLDLMLPQSIYSDANIIRNAIFSVSNHWMDDILNFTSSKATVAKYKKIMEQILSFCTDNKTQSLHYSILAEQVGIEESVVKKLIKKNLLKRLSLNELININTLYFNSKNNSDAVCNVSDFAKKTLSNQDGFVTNSTSNDEINFTKDELHCSDFLYKNKIDISQNDQISVSKSIASSEQSNSSLTHSQLKNSKNTPEQENAINAILPFLQIYKTFLLYGVTGSGKTNVYLSVISSLLEKDPDAQILILLPEITMATSLTQKLDFFCKKVLIWNSSVTTGTKQESIHLILNGEVNIVIGARSAITLPFKKLSMIIVDEEQDSSYKQDEIPTYNARDMSVLRAQNGDFPVILCSATPSVESYFNVKQNKYTLLRMNHRFNGNSLPVVNIVDTSKEFVTRKKKDSTMIVPSVLEMIKKVVANGEQVLIFLNRRGYSRNATCSECGYMFECENCDNKLVHHKSKNILRCHYCSYCSPVHNICVNCKNKATILNSGSYGVEKLMEEINFQIPNASTLIMSSDTMNNQENVLNTIKIIENGEVDIILGTQIATKGYNFPKLKLVVAIGVDIDHIEGDIRIFERTYQLLVQVAGRAGRFNEGGSIIVQTQNPNSPVLHAMISNIEDHFYEEELRRRKKYLLPPYAKQIAIITSSSDEEKAKKAIADIFRCIQDKITESVDITGVKILGPIANTITRLKRQYRHHILLQCVSYNTLQRLINEVVVKEFQKKNNSKDLIVKIDVNPQNIL